MNFEKLYRKYAGSPIRPPAPSGDIELDIPRLGELPVIEDLTEEEMLRWDEFIANQKIEKELKKDLDITKEIGGDKEEKRAPEEGTLPAIPGKKGNLSPDTLLKMCSQYHDLCCKF